VGEHWTKTIREGRPNVPWRHMSRSLHMPLLFACLPRSQPCHLQRPIGTGASSACVSSVFASLFHLQCKPTPEGALEIISEDSSRRHDALVYKLKRFTELRWLVAEMRIRV
jgi:hypothetical protein